MSYTPTEWESTDVVTATRINALETAVGDMNMSYTPNVWSDGDILSAEKMNALEQAVASGGGGSSDFSTATMTVVNGPIPATIPFIQTFGDLQFILGNNYMFETGTYDIVLYKNTATLMTGRTAVTGNAELYDEEEGIWLVSGDITITAE